MIELLVTISVVSIVVALAWPSFRQTLVRNRVATTTNELMSTLMYARSEGMRDPRSGNVCKSPDGLTCLVWGPWEMGIMVWNDRDGNAQVSADEVLRYWRPNKDVWVSSWAGVYSYDLRGRPPYVMEFEIQPYDCLKYGPKSGRRIDVLGSGQIRMRSDVPCL